MKINSSTDSLFANLTSSIKNKQEEKTLWNQQKQSNALFDFSAIQKSAAQTKKQAAYARMAMLKAQLEAMLKFSGAGGVNPKFVAQLARELKSLVAQYGSASGGSGGSVVTVPQISVATGDEASSNGVVAEAEAAAAEAAATETAEVAAAPSVSEADVQAAIAAASDLEDDPSKGTEAEVSSVDDTKQKTGTDNKSSDKAADSAFFTEAKRLAQIIKVLMARAKKAESEEEKKELKRAKNDIAEMDETIANVEKETMAAYSSGGAVDGGAGASSVGAVNAADTTVQPIVNIGNVSIYV